MQFMRRTAGVTIRDKMRSEVIASNLRVTPIMETVKAYRKKWRNHIEKTDETRLPNQVQIHTGRQEKQR